MMSDLIDEIKLELVERQTEQIDQQLEIISKQANMINKLFLVVAMHAEIEEAELDDIIQEINEVAAIRAEMEL